MIQILIWAFIGGAWSLMGRFASSRSVTAPSSASAPTATVLLWNFYGLSPGWAAWWRCYHRRLAAVVAFYLFALPGVGHYFGLVTLAVGEVNPAAHRRRAELDGRLARRVAQAGGGGQVWWRCSSPQARSSTTRRLALWLAGLWCGCASDRSMARSPWSVRRGRDGRGLHRHPRHPLQDRHHRAVGGAHRGGGVAYAQYIAYVNPDTLAGIGVSLRIVSQSCWRDVRDGRSHVGTALTIALSEYLRIGLRPAADRHGRDDLRLPALVFIISCGAASTAASASSSVAGAPHRWSPDVSLGPMADYTVLPPSRTVEGRPGPGRAGSPATAVTCWPSNQERSASTGSSSACCRAPGHGQAPTSGRLATHVSADRGGEEDRSASWIDPGRHARSGVYWTPNGNHRRTTLDKLKAELRTGHPRGRARGSRFQVLPLNTEKAHKPQGEVARGGPDVSRPGRAAAVLDRGRLGAAVRVAPLHHARPALRAEQALSPAAAFAPILRRVDKFLKGSLRKELPERTERAELVRATDETLAQVVAKVKKRGITIPT